MENKYLTAVKGLVLSFLKGENVKIIFFGSRARKEGSYCSDVDIAIIPRGSISKTKLTLLREKIDDLNVPYKIDIVNLSETSGDFQQEILKDAVVWKE